MKATPGTTLKEDFGKNMKQKEKRGSTISPHTYTNTFLYFDFVKTALYNEEHKMKPTTSRRGQRSGRRERGMRGGMDRARK